MTTAPGATIELKVLCGGALREIFNELGAAYYAAHGIKILGQFATSAAVCDRARNGEAFDLVISTQPAIEELKAEGTIVADTAAIVARSAIGVAVRAGQPKPDISSTAVFVAAMRNAGSIARADPAMRTPSGVYLAGLFDRLGLTAELKAKTRLIGAVGGAPVVVCEVVASGEAEIGLQQISEIIAVPGVDLVGPLPDELQHLTVFSVAVGSASGNPAAARAFAAFLVSPGAKPVIAAHGMVPD